VSLEGKASHLVGHLTAGVGEVEIDGLFGRGAELAGLKGKNIAVLGVDEELLVVDHVSELAGYSEEMEIWGLVYPPKPLILGCLYWEVSLGRSVEGLKLLDLPIT
jgi:hypothetical protein